ncbi:aryl-alcohol dehydrogenase-like predicted oxidoreductase/enamine deaminase RidA (YjgF/YER057c/UK114 family) [Catalinimonas alkaloidigena]|uniref:aldo/keto reductase n=1 Tax=Catalinimonas alkaloidigena TaxID=1075417 RepID=UPI002404E415|nr:aldo/keto reductase [Catalinimonas alkaloidigena]MDF9800821.1 aryl-alcohol dehydrogenase-like predicted oxidoreductase/enamine deaminase RidA (YjgF/YER057c/UK114 family) [Catalinimonas alkaloidigena]
MQKYCELAPDLKISRVLTGLWQIADMEKDGTTLDPEESARAMTPYVEAGFTTFDMADHYGSAEIISGTFKKQHASDKQVQLLTKWVPRPGPTSKQEVREAVQKALDRMQLETIDLMQFHAWNYADPNWLDCLFWLQELKEEGLIRHLGLTNFDAAHLRVAVSSGIEIVSNQVCHSLIDQRAAQSMTEVCKQYGVKLLVFGTVAGGFLSEKWLNKPEPKMEELSTWSQMKYKRFIDAAGGWKKFQHLLKVAHQVAQKHNASIANISSCFMLNQPAVAGIILGARLGKSEHIAENQRIFDIHLDAEDLQSIREAQSALSPIPGGCGDEYRKPPFLTASGDLSDHLESIPTPFEVVDGHQGRKKIFSGTVWEDMAGYCRAIRSGDRILVSGTTATHGSRMIGGKDAAAQAHFVIDKIQGALESLGGCLEDVDRTRIFVNNINDWEAVARTHGERFKDIQPANTLVQARLVGEGYLVEIEAEARI